jgi:hypothetical protein
MWLPGSNVARATVAATTMLLVTTVPPPHGLLRAVAATITDMAPLEVMVPLDLPHLGNSKPLPLRPGNPLMDMEDIPRIPHLRLVWVPQELLLLALAPLPHHLACLRCTTVPVLARLRHHLAKGLLLRYVFPLTHF